MPTRAKIPTPDHHLGYEEQHSWTDDLPVCKQSGKLREYFLVSNQLTGVIPKLSVII